MPLNKTIIKKIRDKTVNESDVGDFLLNLLEFESESPGWYRDKYIAFLECACKEE
jgi:hypothetical protein